MSHHTSESRTPFPHISTLIPELWDCLSDREREIFILRSRVYTCEEGECIYPHAPTARGEERSVITLVDGQALTYYLYNGEVPIHFTGKEMLGLARLLTGMEDWYTCKALTKCLVLSLPAEIVEMVIDNNARASKLLLTRALRALHTKDMRLIVLNTRRMPGRMASTLLYLDQLFGREGDGQTLRVRLTRCLLGGLSNMTTSNATRVLRSLEDDGMIALQGKEIKILKETALVDVSRHG